MESVGRSVTGMLREKNEDNIFISSKGKLNLYIVADGMGGHNAGEVASSFSIEMFNEYFDKAFKDGINEDNALDTMVEAISFCNRELYLKSLSKKEYSGMGTTFLATLIIGKKLYIVHVGDSRLYIFSKGELKQLTSDHSFVMEMVRKGKITKKEAKRHPQRNVITRAVGSEENVDIDTIMADIYINDIILICSDGLTNMVTDDKIKETLEKDITIEEKVTELIDIANENGGKDNISIIIVKADGLGVEE
ncbi:MAG: Stp1/IreP family PP2C-type Ser/Thr phosphatase [Lachnospiraceae bacterium]|nr:Stp1/IreP family PP2C-type Ser/Thr phosphatase [Lachnospiraceae bacterium]